MTGGDPLAVKLLLFFIDPDGDELTFSNEASSDTAVATVVLSDSTLTITAVAAGTSTISVTASDPDGLNVTGSVKLTVSDPTPTGPEPVSFKKGETAERSIPADQHLESANKRIVTVALKAGSTTDWTLTAEAKGMAVVNIVSEREVVGTISVTVNNTAPTTISRSPNATYVMRPPPNQSDLKDKTADDNLRKFFEVNNEPGLFFIDTDGDTLTYHARSSSKDVLVEKVTADHVILDMLKKNIGGSIILTVHAEDIDGALSDAVEFDVEVNTADGPLSDTYDVTQYINGEFKSIDVWDREDTSHTLMFKDVLVQNTDGTSAAETGYKFAAAFQKANEDATELDYIPGAGLVRSPSEPEAKVPFVTDHRGNVAAPIGPTNPATVPPVAGTAGADNDITVLPVRHYYTVSTTGPVAVWMPKAAGFHALLGDTAASPVLQPQMLLRVTGPGPATGTVTIMYHLLVDTDGNEYDPETGLAHDTPLLDSTAENADNKWIVKSETLTVSVMASR